MRDLARPDGRPLVAPSILSANFAQLGDEVRALEAAGADLVHVDVMDGRFVPNITIGPLVVKALRAVTKLPLDVHLMIVEPERYVGEFVKAGADIVTVHVEASPHLHRTLQEIRGAGARAGVALNPHTPIESIELVLGDLDLVLVMSVNPGFGGQSFLPVATKKLGALREAIARSGSSAVLEVDGGIAPKTSREVVRAGASLLVAGSAVFGAAAPGASYDERVLAYRDAIEATRAGSA